MNDTTIRESKINEAKRVAFRSHKVDTDGRPSLYQYWRQDTNGTILSGSRETAEVAVKAATFSFVKLSEVAEYKAAGYYACGYYDANQKLTSVAVGDAVYKLMLTAPWSLILMRDGKEVGIAADNLADLKEARRWFTNNRLLLATEKKERSYLVPAEAAERLVARGWRKVGGSKDGIYMAPPAKIEIRQEVAEVSNIDISQPIPTPTEWPTILIVPPTTEMVPDDELDEIYEFDDELNLVRIL